MTHARPKAARTGSSAIVRGVLKLSIGTATTRMVAAVGQVALALWLAPTEFGYWAAATSMISVISGIMNFGEVNGYLSRPGASLYRLRHVTRRMNSLLALTAAPIVLGYLYFGSPITAVLAAMVAASIPLQGEADVLYAAYVKQNRQRKLVVAQAISAVSKTLVGVGLAMLTGSAIAIGVSFMALPMLMIAALWRSAEPWSVEVGDREVVPSRLRFAWAINSLSQTGPTQVGFLVTQFAASASLLGIYYLAYQVTAGISGLISVPLSRTILSALGDSAPEARPRLALQMANYFVGLTGLAASAIAIALVYVGTHVDGHWAAAFPTTMILLAGLPVRMLTPVMDAFQQASNRWRQSTTFNIVDTVGTAAAALSALSGDVIVLAIATSVWKICFGIVRLALVLRDRPFASRLGMNAKLAGIAVPLVVGGLPDAPAPAAWFIVSGGVALLMLMRASGPRDGHLSNGPRSKGQIDEFQVTSARAVGHTHE